jgi:hypothetical protein
MIKNQSPDVFWRKISRKEEDGSEKKSNEDWLLLLLQAPFYCLLDHCYSRLEAWKVRG